MLRELITFLGGSAIFLAAVAWLIRSIVGQMLSKDIERFKADLRVQSAAHEHQQIRLVEMRAEVLTELYKRLLRFLGRAEVFVSPITYEGDPTKQEKAQELGAAAGAFREHFNDNRIFLSNSFCSRVDSLWEKTFSSTRKYAFWMNRDENELNEKTMEAWQRAWDCLRKEIPPLLEELQDEVRSILGVENET